VLDAAPATDGLGERNVQYAYFWLGEIVERKVLADASSVDSRKRERIMNREAIMIKIDRKRGVGSMAWREWTLSAFVANERSDEH
jgi:hypothetical protein